MVRAYGRHTESVIYSHLSYKDKMITNAVASSEAVNEIVLKLEPVLLEYPREQVIIACLAVAIAAQKPDLTEKELIGAVEGASRWICLYLAEVPEGMDTASMN